MNAERGSLGLKVDALKEMCLELTLVEEGRPEAAITIGDDPGHRVLAERIAAGVERATGCRLPIVEAAKVRAEVLLDRHTIAIGNMADNAFIRWLYHRWWAVEDRCYPGSGGYAIRTLHNLLGNGKGAVLVGASDAAGLERAASRFVELVPKGKTLRLGWQMEVRLGPEFDFLVRPPEGWLEERRRDLFERAVRPHASEAGVGFQLVSEAGAYGLM
jgi:hypothetical protein